MFINSSTPTETLIKIAQKRKLDVYFSGIYGAFNTKIKNLELISQLNLTVPDEIVVIGDGVSDQKSAQSFGCHFKISQLDNWIKALKCQTKL